MGFRGVENFWGPYGNYGMDFSEIHPSPAPLKKSIDFTSQEFFSNKIYEHSPKITQSNIFKLIKWFPRKIFNQI
jgi:hypothetical protein